MLHNRAGVVLLLAAAAAPQPAAARGRLVIAGSGPSAGTQELWRAFANARPPGARTIVVMAAASTQPLAAARPAGGALHRAGARPEQVALSSIGLAPDPALPDCAGATEAVEGTRIARAGAICFTSGSQLHMARALPGADGSDAQILAGIRARPKASAAVSGTAARAAIMANPMIATGKARQAPMDLVRRMGAGAGAAGGEGLARAPNLGSLPAMPASPRCAERGGPGRPLVALAQRPRRAPIGIGADEDTALVVDKGCRCAQAPGQGRAWLVAARRTRLAATAGSATGVRLSLPPPGHAADLRRLIISQPIGATR